MPLYSDASFLSNILGSEVYASVGTDNNKTETIFKNSQTLALLEANVFSSLVIKDKNTKSEDTDIKEEETINIVSENALSPAISLLDVAGSQSYEDSFSDQVSIYVVRKGDSISKIADMFGVSVNTIYWANDLKKGDKLKEGATLVILPFNGLTHIVKAKETLVGIAKLYKADVDDIIAFNGLSKDDKLSVGDELIIPDGQKSENNTKPAKISNSNIANNKSNSNLKSLDNYFIFPLPFKKLTQGTHDIYAKDYGAPTGTPIYASAGGTVVIARNGYNGGYGNFVIIKHPNGTETRYAHMSKIRTTAGKSVEQGELIGEVGSTGRSTGPHLHFEVRGVKFPF